MGERRAVLVRVRVAAVLAALTLLVGGLVPSAVPDAAAAAKPKATIKVSTSKVVAGAAVKITGTVKGAKKRQKVTLQVKKPGSGWVTAASKKLSNALKVSFSQRPTLGTSQYRLVATVNKKTVRSRAVKVTTSLKIAPQGKVFAGQKVKVSGTLPTAVKRPVRLQVRSGSSWKTAGTLTSSAKGKFTFTVTTSSTVKVRVQAPKATVKKTKHAAFTSSAASLSVRAHQAKVTVPSPVCVVQPISASVTSTSIGAKRAVQIQLARPGAAWRTVATGTTTTAGSVQVALEAPAESGTYGVRVVVAKSGQVPAVASEAAILEVTDCGGLPAPEPPVVAAGGNHSCALTGDGDILCWGDNAQHQLGVSDPAARTDPVKVPTSVKFQDVDAANYLSCGIDTTGRVLCWGTYSALSMSHDYDVVRTTPRVESGSLKFSRIAVGQYQVCGISNAGQAWCWGLKQTGEEAGGGPWVFSSPVLVPGNRRYVDIVAYQYSTCALTTSGQRWCWNGIGPADAYVDPPTQLRGDPAFTSMGYTCGLTAAGKAYCWGSDFFGQLGDGPGGPAQAGEPVAVIGGHTFKAISSVNGSTGTACALNTAGRAFCWGYGAFGQIGDGYTNSRNSPAEVFFIGPTRTFKQISVGNRHVCAVRDEGLSIYCWGENTKGQLGSGSLGSISSQPRIVNGF